jgi:hypothetical protein
VYYFAGTNVSNVINLLVSVAAFSYILLCYYKFKKYASMGGGILFTFSTRTDLLDIGIFNRGRRFLVGIFCKIGMHSCRPTLLK